MMLSARNSPYFRVIAAIFGLFIIAGLILFFLRRPWLTQEELQQRIITAIQSESRESFLVTGSLDLTVTLTQQNTKVLLPGILDVPLGEARATAQVPGRVFYGIDTRKLEASSIRVVGDTVFVRVPQPSLLSVDVNLAELRVATSKGWLRSGNSMQQAERSAVRGLNAAFARQAANYVANSSQPRVNTARTLEGLLRPVLGAAGISNPSFRFELGEQLQLESSPLRR